MNAPPTNQPQIPGFPERRELFGLRRGCPAGPARLMAELVMRGLKPEDRPAAAALALALDREAADDREAGS